MVADMAKVFGNPAPAESAKSSTPAPLHRPVAEASNGNTFGMSAQGDEEQLVLRAMLGVSETLDLPRVLELTSRLPGVSACAHIRDAHVTADGDSSEPSQNFRQQAPDIARSMRTLAEVTGLDAETLSIATNDRQITFCFQGGSVFGVLHSDKTPPAGLREKITLLSREVARMSA